MRDKAEVKSIIDIWNLKAIPDESAALALGRIGSDKATIELSNRLRALKAPQQRQRKMGLVDALALTHSKVALPALRDALAGADLYLQARIAGAILAISYSPESERDALNVARQVIESRSWRAKAIFAQMIAQSDNRAVMKLKDNLKHDEFEVVRRFANGEMKDANLSF